MPSKVATPYAVICPKHGQVFLTTEEYNTQMSYPDALWVCPNNECRHTAEWDDDNYEEHMFGEEECQ